MDNGRELGRICQRISPRTILNCYEEARQSLCCVLRRYLRVQEALNGTYHLGIASNGTWEETTGEGYRHHQQEIGSAPEFVDGIPGPLDLTALGAGRFTVTD